VDRVVGVSAVPRTSPSEPTSTALVNVEPTSTQSTSVVMAAMISQRTLVSG
jgi:hypothetical protein